MMRHLRQLTFALLVLAAASPASAFFELNAFYYSDTMTTSGSAAHNRMNIEGCLGFAIDKKDKYLVGWGYHMMTSSNQAVGAQAETYSSTQMGPRFIVGVDKNNEWTVGLAYYLVTNASYSDGSGSSVTWKGTALKFDFGYNFAVSENFSLGMRFNYASATYSEQLVGSTTYSTVGYAATSMYPSLYSIYYF